MDLKSHIWRKKKPGLGRVSLGSRVNPPGRSSWTRSLHWPVFWQTQASPASGSVGSRVDPPGRSEFNNYDFQTKKIKKKNNYYRNIIQALNHELVWYCGNNCFLKKNYLKIHQNNIYFLFLNFFWFIGSYILLIYFFNYKQYLFISW
jgi:hypothetical protein